MIPRDLTHSSNQWPGTGQLLIITSAFLGGIAVGTAFSHRRLRRIPDSEQLKSKRVESTAEQVANCPKEDSTTTKENPTAVVRSATYHALAAHLHGSDEGPFAESGAAARLPEDHSYPHTNLPPAFLAKLFALLRPEYLVEIGSFKGGSALRIADAATAALAAVEASGEASGEEEGGGPPVVVCVDTFLGDAGMWLNRWAGSRKGLLLEHGLPNLYFQFLANTRRRQVRFQSSTNRGSSFFFF